MRITKKVREQAWLICAIAASAGEFVAYHDAFIGTGAPRCAYILAREAWAYAFARTANCTSNEVDAEAAALLAEGWTPEGWS